MLVSWFRSRCGEGKRLRSPAPISVSAEGAEAPLPLGTAGRRGARFIEIGLTAAAFAHALRGDGVSRPMPRAPVRIGFQKYGTLVLLKSKGLLEEKLKPLGFTVEWTEFPAGPQLLEALNVGAIDYRHDRRGAADLRAGRRRAARLCRLRAAGAARRGDPGARRTARSRRSPT